MSQRQIMGAFVVLILALSAAWGQDSSTDNTPQQPVPAFGPDNPVPSINDNPPLTGLDLPNLEPHSAPESHLQTGAHVSESVDSNVQNTLGGSATSSISRGMGSLDLERLWSHYDLALDYLGGVAYYDVQGEGFKQIEELGVNQKISWKRGQLDIRDAFSYQPEGNFGSAYGAVGTTGAGLSGSNSFSTGQGLGALGQVPRIMNLSLVDAVQNLTPKSSITVTGGYGFVHFLGNEPGLNASFIGNSQVTAQVGYNRVLGVHDQGALMYAYQGFGFSSGVAFHSHVVQLMWGHRISGRMDFLIGAGPQLTLIDNLPTEFPLTSPKITPSCIPVFGSGFQVVGAECLENDRRLSAAGRASLRYRFPKASLDLSYDHYITSGSGFFAGAESDIARVNVSRPLNRIWTVFSDIGFSRNSRVSSLTLTQLAACTPSPTNPNPLPCPGTVGNTYQYGFAGAGVHRMFGRNFHAFASYQFNYLAFDSSYCAATGTVTCSRISQRSVGTIGLDWTPRPIRLD
jgi:hypothetical protein